MQIKVNQIDTGIYFADDECLSYDAENRLLIELRCSHQNAEVKVDYQDNSNLVGWHKEYYVRCPDCQDENLTQSQVEYAIEAYKNDLYQGEEY